jgi:predicted helicase
LTEGSELSKSPDERRLKWSWRMNEAFAKQKSTEFLEDSTTLSIYRPFNKTWFYRDYLFNENQYSIPKILPTNELENRFICVTGIGTKAGFSCLIVDRIPDIQLMFNSQCFPLWVYDEQDLNDGLFAAAEKSSLSKKSGVSEFAFKHFKLQIGSDAISEEDVFYYIYSILHHEDYRRKYENNLSKELPRIPVCKDIELFINLASKGRELAELHINYENASCYSTQIKEGHLDLAHIDDKISFYRVEKMKFAKKGDKSTVIYNKNITIENIPLEAYEYVVNGKPALEWVMERQCVKTDKASGIVNDANDYANETMNNPAYPLELFQRVITVSLETMKIVKSLPHLDIS